MALERIEVPGSPIITKSMTFSAKILLKFALVSLMLSASALADKPSSLFETANPPVAELPQIRLTIGAEPLDVEVASSPGTMARGLMFRTSLATDKGMLFVFPTDHQASFWMRNTSIPLSLAYIDKEGRILEILSLIPFEETPVKSKTDRVRYALEVNRDWFSVHNIKAGTLIQNLPRLKDAP
jgi:uncharacterized membrane protein (UPF0127 family)